MAVTLLDNQAHSRGKLFGLVKPGLASCILECNCVVSWG